MVTVEALFIGVQFLLILGLLILAKYIAREFGTVVGWQQIWIAFGVAFAGMFEALGLTILITSGIDRPWLRWIRAFLPPVQIYSGLVIGMLLLIRFLRRIRSLHGLIHLPHPAGFVLDMQSVVLSWDTGAEELFGWTADEVLHCPGDATCPMWPHASDRHTLQEMISPTRLRRVGQAYIVDRYLAEGNPLGQSQRYTLTCRYRMTPTEFPVEVILTPEPTENGTIQLRGIAKRLSAR